MKKIVKVMIFVMIMCLWSMKVYGITGITLDGRFGDWADKPYVADTVGDGDFNEDLIKVSWYPDVAQNRLYMNLTRSSRYKPGKWDSYVDIIVGTESYHISINCNTNSRKVGVWLYDKSYTLLWYGSGYWSDNIDVEIYVPLTGIVDVGGSGYTMDVYAFTYSDDVPNQGPIVISTISTFPILTLIISGLIIILTYIKRRKGGCYDFFSTYLGWSSRTLK